MGAVQRGIKNAFRNVTRTIAIVFILSVSICLALTMFIALKTVNAKIESVKSSVGNTITVSPAGMRGFEGGGNLLSSENAKTIAANSKVLNVVSLLSDRLTPGTDTNLTASLTPGSFGSRQRRQEQTPSAGSSQESSGGLTQARSFTMPITVIGTNCLGNFSALNLTSFSLTSGKVFDVNSSENVALLGKDLAAKNNLKTGSTFTAYGNTITVMGIFDGGNTFANSSLLMPLAAVQKLSAQTGGISNMIVTVKSIDDLDAVKSNISSKLGSAADVTTSAEQVNQVVEPLKSIQTISLYSLIGSLMAGAVIIFLTMLMIVRERRKEIGVLKAIGGSNFVITSQFMVEAMVLTMMAGILGTIGGFFLSNPILSALVTNTTASSAGPGRGGFGGGIRMIGLGFRGAFQSLHAAIGYDVIAYGLLAAVIIAVIGSAIPAYLLSKIRPAEVMRAE